MSTFGLRLLLEIFDVTQQRGNMGIRVIVFAKENVGDSPLLCHVPSSASVLWPPFATFLGKHCDLLQ